MQRALQLASLGLGSASPNPMVGAVLVHDANIIGEGWHKKYGGPHAEVEAIRNVNESHLIEKSTLYVTLEPCSHHGKTPPCADLIIKNKIKRVVVAMLDPNPLVAGKGIAKLKNAGLEVEVGLLESEAQQLNKRFVTFHEKKRPYVLLKWAQTADGFIAPSLEADPKDKQISNTLSQQLVHKWRAEEEAIMVGANTFLHDRPQLNVRYWATHKQPVKIVFDAKGNIVSNYPSDQFQGWYVFNFEKEDSLQYFKLNRDEAVLEQIMARLYQKGIGSVLVEGGTGLLNQFLEANLWDEARVGISPKVFAKGIEAPVLRLPAHEQFFLKEDHWQIFFNRPIGHAV
ncbi:MAG TPA: bifunctional diaminohydroxyphosphoribosylaminopyrimidine deaminase/5-amino-6-(5-phosphoribosylamino)uracil reductase RibD [Cytophagales bacterium]|nr:bifunctional diaminohydroxyphosphoribosylaminopyrimidine deaminase/5-amino-6-(5-phosphoribosylamino)uracil reductase RibD [Cytophagales bacterium]